MARTAKQIIRTIGRCIYCDSTEDLTEEHIIPFSLGANMTLDQASCKACAKITGDVELQVARPVAGMLRTRLGIQTRNPEARKLIPKQLTYADGSTKAIMIAPEEFPSLFTYPIFGKPGILEGREREGVYRTSEKPWSLGQDADHKRIADAFLAKHGCMGFTYASFRPAVLMNFVAKVGHAAVTALLGPDGFEPLVKKAAISPNEVFDDVLGGQGGCFAPNPDALHSIEIRQIEGPAGKLIFARLMWFANLSAASTAIRSHEGSAPPPLLAIVGRPIDDRLAGKLGYINVRANGEECWSLVDMPKQAKLVPAPSMR